MADEPVAMSGGMQQPLGAHDDAIKPDDTAEIEEPMLQFFSFNHLTQELQKISEPFYVLARYMALALPRNPERTAGLRKLLEAKDCAVRARLYK